MQDHQTEVTRRLKAANAMTALLAAARIGLELMERAGTALAELGPEENFPAYETSVRETVEAARALAAAPSLNWPDLARRQTTTAPQEFEAQLTALALAVHRALLSAADKSIDPADRIACLEAALHTNRAGEALR